MYYTYTSRWFKMKKALLLFVWILSQVSNAQNLVLNSSFEEHKTCEFIISAIDTNYNNPGVVYDWCSGNVSGSPDYFNACQVYNENWNCMVPVNKNGRQSPVSGTAYAGIAIHSYFAADVEFREYIQTKLSHKLKKGVSYCIGFYTSFAENDTSIINNGWSTGAAKNWGLLLSSDRPFNTIDVYSTHPSPPNSYIISGDPQIKTNDFVADTANWTLIGGTYLATGDEEWITIGNFNPIGQTPIDTFYHGITPNIISYYYIDNVFVIAMNDGSLLPSDTSVCQVSLPLPISATAGFTHYEWSNGDTTQQSTLTEPGLYTLEAVFEGCPVSDSIFVDTLPAPTLHLQEVRYCASQLPETYALPDSPVFHTYIWSDGSTGRSLSVERSGDFIVEASGACGIATDTLHVLTDSLLQIDLGEDRSLCLEGTNVSLELSNLKPERLPNYRWSTGQTTEQIEVNVPGVYTLQAENGCGIFSDEILLTGCEPAVYVPNIFSPSSANVENTHFRAYAAHAEIVRLEVYDRWGSLIFREESDGPGWDGTWKGKLCQAGVYLYRLEYRNPSTGIIQTVNGTVSLVQ